MTELVKVLDLNVVLEAEGEEGGEEAFRGQEALLGAGVVSTFRYPVLKVEMRVGVGSPVVGDDASEEDLKRAAGLLRGAVGRPWGRGV